MDPIFPLLIGLFLSSMGLYMFWHNFWLQIKGSKATGTVLEIRNESLVRDSKSVFVIFKTQEDKVVKLRIKMPGLLARFYQKGNKISVLYDPHNPTYATINAIGVMYLEPILLITFGLVFIWASWAGEK